jgi:hypothetical protein
MLWGWRYWRGKGVRCSLLQRCCLFYALWRSTSDLKSRSLEEGVFLWVVGSPHLIFGSEKGIELPWRAKSSLGRKWVSKSIRKGESSSGIRKGGSRRWRGG